VISALLRLSGIYGAFVLLLFGIALLPEYSPANMANSALSGGHG
jgi:hypothetical protein